MHMNTEASPPRKIIACATVAEELRALGVEESELQVLEFGLHIYPEKLKSTLQEAISATPGEMDILLGYGLCCNAMVGLHSDTHRLVVPKVDDCIALFLGSKAEQLRLLVEEPGTYYLTKGWIEAAEAPYDEFLRMAERYGEEKAMKLARIMLANYKRVALINTGNYHMEDYRAVARHMAEFFELRFEELPGSNRLLEKMLNRDWDGEFIVCEAGRTVELADFLSPIT